MKVGDIVKVKTKFYGTKRGVIVKHCQFHGFFIKPDDHPRMIVTTESQDVEVIVPISRHNKRMEELGL